MNIGLVEAKSIILASLSLSYVVVGLETQFYLIYVCDIEREFTIGSVFLYNRNRKCLLSYNIKVINI